MKNSTSPLLPWVIVVVIVFFSRFADGQVTPTPGSFEAQGGFGGNGLITIPASAGKLSGTNLLHSFDTFNINGTTITGAQFTDLGVSSPINNVVARVTGGSASTINGALSTAHVAGGGFAPNVNLFLVNPQGVIFGPNASISVPGNFVASTANYVVLGDQTHIFYSDPSKDASSGLTMASGSVSAFGFFAGTTPKPIVVAGSQLSNAGGLQFIGGDFTAAPDANGATATLTAANLGIFSVGTAGAGVNTTGTADVTKDSTVPYLTGAVTKYTAGSGDFTKVQNTTSFGNVTFGSAATSTILGTALGKGSAKAIATGANGHIVIRGGTMVVQNGSSITAPATGGTVDLAATDFNLDSASALGTGGSGAINLLASGDVTDAGTISAAGTESATATGGHVVVTGANVHLKSTAVVDVSGNAGGGTAKIGGGAHGTDTSIANAKTTTVDAGAQIIADALRTGNAGQVVVWSDNDTEFFGSVSAQGGAISGNGGSVEVSGDYLNFQGAVNTLAANGKVGNLLLDPATLNVITTGTGTLVGGANDGTSTTISPATIQGNGGLATTNVTLSATNTITVSSDISWTTDNTLTLESGTITTAAAITGSGATSTLNLMAGNGGINFNGGTAIALTNGGTVTASSTGGTVEHGNGAISASNLLLSGSGDVFLNHPTDTFGTVAVNLTSGNVTLSHTSGFAVGTVGGTAGITVGAGSTVSLTAGGLTLNQGINATGDTVSLSSTAGVTGTGAITADTLTFSGSGGVNLTGSGNVANLSTTSYSGALAFNNGANDLNIGDSSNNALNIGAANALTLTTTGSITQTQAVTAGTVTLKNTANANLFTKTNAIAALSTGGTTTGPISLKNSGALVIGDGASNGVDVGANSLTLSTTGAITQNASINAGILYIEGSTSTNLFTNVNSVANLSTGTSTTTGPISLNNGSTNLKLGDGGGNGVNVGTGGGLVLTAGAVTENAVVTAGTLTLKGVAGANLGTQTNAVTGLSTGGTASTGDITLSTNKALTIGDANNNGVNVGGHNLTLTTTGTVTQNATGVITANTLLIKGTTGANLSTANNAVANLSTGGVTAGGSINLKNGSTNLNVGSGGNGVNVGTSNNLTLTSTGSITQSSAIVAGTLSTSSAGGTTLTNAGNDVQAYTGANSGSGDITFANGANVSGGVGLTVNSVTQTGGGDVSVTNNGGITLARNATISLDGGQLTLDNSASGTGADVTVLGTISDGSGTVLLNSSAAITDNDGNLSHGEGTITADTLTTTSVGDTFLNGANVVSNFSATGVNITLTADSTSGPVNIDTINNNGTGNVTLSTTTSGLEFNDAVSLGQGNLTLDAAAYGYAFNVPLSGNTLTLGGKGTYILVGSGNQFQALVLNTPTGSASSYPEVEYIATGDFSISAMTNNPLYFLYVDTNGTVTIPNKVNTFYADVFAQNLIFTKTNHVNGAIDTASAYIDITNQITDNTGNTPQVFLPTNGFYNYKNNSPLTGFIVKTTSTAVTQGGQLSHLPTFGVVNVVSNNIVTPPPPLQGQPGLGEVILDSTLSNATIATDSSTYTVSLGDGVQVGDNLFLSFLELNLGSTETLDLNATGSATTPVQNIYIRVTGGQPSIIEGNLQGEFDAAIKNASISIDNPYGVVLYSANETNLGSNSGGGVTFSNSAMANSLTSTNITFTTATSVNFGPANFYGVSASMSPANATAIQSADNAIIAMNPAYAGTPTAYEFNSGFLPSSVTINPTTSKTGYTFNSDQYFSVSVSSSLLETGNTTSIGTLQLIGGNVEVDNSFLYANNIVAYSATAPALSGASGPTTSGTVAPYSGDVSVAVNSDQSAGLLAIPSGGVGQLGTILVQENSALVSQAGILQASANNVTLDGSTLVDQLGFAEGSTVTTAASANSQIIIQTQDLTIQTSNGSDSFISSANLSDVNVTGTGLGIPINIYANNLTITGNSDAGANVGIFASAEPINAFDTLTAAFGPVSSYANYGSGAGYSGNIDLYLGTSLSITNSGQINGTTNGPGAGGTVTIGPLNPTDALNYGLSTGTPTVSIVGGAINTSSSIFPSPQTGTPYFSTTGAAGNVNINAATFNLAYDATDMVSAEIVSSSGLPPGAGSDDSASSLTGQGGQISIDVTNSGNSFTMTGAGTSTTNLIGVNPTLSVGCLISAATYTNRNGGDVGISSPGALSLAAGAQIYASTTGAGSGGGVSIGYNIVSGRFDPPTSLSISGTNSGISAEAGAGSAGVISLYSGQQGSFTPAIEILAGSVKLDSGASINSSTAGAGSAGYVYVDAESGFANGGTGVLQLSGNSSIITNTTGQGGGGPSNAGGNVYLFSSGAFTMDTGASVQAGTSGNGQGGSVQIDSSTMVSLDNATVVASTIGTGLGGPSNAGGSVSIYTFGAVQLSNSASILAGSIGNGDGGSVSIDTPSTVSIASGSSISVATSGTGASGSVTIGTYNFPSSVTLDGTGSGILATVSNGGTGVSTAVQINTDTLTIQNGAAINSSTSGAGIAGDITLNCNATLNGMLNILSGGQINSSTSGAGKGGSINITVTGNGNPLSVTPSGDVIVSGGGQITAGNFEPTAGSTTPIGAAGSITINQSGSTDLGSATAGVSISGNSQISTSAAAVVAAGSNTQVGSITINAQNLTVNGSTIAATTGGSYDGGTITLNVTGGMVGNPTFSGASGDVIVSNSGKITAGSSEPSSSMTAPVGTAGSIFINQKASTDLATNPGAGVLVESGGVISTEAGAQVASSSGGEGDLVINTQALTVNGGKIQADTSGVYQGGQIFVFQDSATQYGPNTFTNTTTEPYLTSFTPAAGFSFVNVAADTVQAINLSGDGQISSGSSGSKAGGDINLVAGSLTVTGDGTTANPTSQTQISANASGSGNGGTINIIVTGNMPAAESGDLQVTAGGLITADTETAMNSSGKAGSITITQSGSMDVSPIGTTVGGNTTYGGIWVDGAGSQISTQAGALSNTPSGTGAITLNTQGLVLTNGGSVVADTSGSYNGGNITVQASAGGAAPTQFVELLTGGQITSGSSLTGKGGDISIYAGSLNLTGLTGATTDAQTQISANTAGAGNGGSINISTTIGTMGDPMLTGETGDINIINGASISASSTGAGAAGKITIAQSNNVFIDGQGSKISSDAGPVGFQYPVPPSNTADLDTYLNTYRGDITISAQNLTVSDNASITATTGFNADGTAGALGYSPGGKITIMAPGNVTLSNNGTINASSGSNASVVNLAAGYGNGGSILIGDSANVAQGLAAMPDSLVSPVNLNILNSSQIIAGSLATTGGNISVYADNVNIQNFSKIETKGDGPSNNGGSIVVSAESLFYLNNFSDISTHSGGQGGNIYIDPQFEILNHSFIDAFGGNGDGNVVILSDFTLSGDSSITASGTVTIASFPLDLSGSLAVLPADLTDEAKRLRESCARAVNHEFSSLIVVGRSGTETAPDELNSDSGSGAGGGGSASAVRSQEKLR